MQAANVSVVSTLSGDLETQILEDGASLSIAKHWECQHSVFVVPGDFPAQPEIVTAQAEAEPQAMSPAPPSPAPASPLRWTARNYTKHPEYLRVLGILKKNILAPFTEEESRILHADRLQRYEILDKWNRIEEGAPQAPDVEPEPVIAATGVEVVESEVEAPRDDFRYTYDTDLVVCKMTANMGVGVYAAKDIPSGKKVTRYYGHVRCNNSDREYNEWVLNLGFRSHALHKQGADQYVAGITRPVPAVGVGSLVNASLRPNCKYVWDGSGICMVVSTKRIPTGAQLFANYRAISKPIEISEKVWRDVPRSVEKRYSTDSVGGLVEEPDTEYEAEPKDKEGGKKRRKQ